MYAQGYPCTETPMRARMLTHGHWIISILNPIDISRTTRTARYYSTSSNHGSSYIHFLLDPLRVSIMFLISSFNVKSSNSLTIQQIFSVTFSRISRTFFFLFYRKIFIYYINICRHIEKFGNSVRWKLMCFFFFFEIYLQLLKEKCKKTG